MGAILELYAIDPLVLEQALRESAERLDSRLVFEMRQLDGSLNDLDDDAVRAVIADGLASRLAIDADGALTSNALWALIRAFGFQIGDVSINSSAIARFVSELDALGLSQLIGSTALRAESVNGARFGLLAGEELQGVAEQLRELEPSENDYVLPIGVLEDAIEEALWRSAAIVTVFN